MCVCIYAGSCLAVLSGSCAVPKILPLNEGDRDTADWEKVEYIDVVPMDAVGNSFQCGHGDTPSQQRDADAVYVVVEECMDTQCKVDFGSTACMVDWIDAINNQEDKQLHDYI